VEKNWRQKMNKKWIFFTLTAAFLLLFAGNYRAQDARERYILTVQVTGAAAGEIISSPPGITCGQEVNDCSESFAAGTPVILRPRSLGAGEFRGWSVSVGSTQPCSASRGDCYFILMENSSARAEFTAD